MQLQPHRVVRVTTNIRTYTVYHECLHCEAQGSILRENRDYISLAQARLEGRQRCTKCIRIVDRQGVVLRFIPLYRAEAILLVLLR